jgi:hypothetical protein
MVKDGIDPNRQVDAMKRTNELHSQLPVHDYGRAVQNALSWLGDRYLLAAPIAVRKHDRDADSGFIGTRRRHGWLRN